MLDNCLLIRGVQIEAGDGVRGIRSAASGRLVTLDLRDVQGAPTSPGGFLIRCSAQRARVRNGRPGPDFMEIITCFTGTVDGPATMRFKIQNQSRSWWKWSSPTAALTITLVRWLVRVAATQTACDRLDRRDRGGSEDGLEGGDSENFYSEPKNYFVTGCSERLSMM